MSLRIDTETRYEKTITIVPTLVGSNRNSVCNFIKNPLYYKEGMVDFCISERKEMFLERSLDNRKIWMVS